MKIYNTMTKTKEEFIPIEEGKVRMYVCGPTVYNFIHIGNARMAVMFDTVRRYLEYKGYFVNYILNYTDVDDKIIKSAIEEGVDSKEISERFIKEYIKDTSGLNVLPATLHPKATEEIDGMIEMISELIKKDHAYEKNGTVYFRTRSFRNYGKLSKKNIDELESGARIAVNDEKDDPLDFVLWKPKKEGEPSWTSPWGDGRPGWHIECSVMSKKYLGEQIDIHAGGEDLIFPHHENEIAQTESLTGKEFAKYWMHNAFINIDNKKMSKSKGNFFTIREISEKYPFPVIRFFLLSVHYRSPINFSEEIIEAAQNGLERIQTAIKNLSYLIKLKKESQAVYTYISDEEVEIIDKLKEIKIDFEQAMDDDFNTADAVTAIFEAVKVANVYVNADSSYELIETVSKEIEKLCMILGIEAMEKEESLNEEIEQMIEDRQKARKEKNFQKADEIRNKLLNMGIVLEDTREGVKWKKA